MGGVFIKCTRPLKKIEQVKAHARYVGFRSQEMNKEQHVGFFGRDTDHASHKDFIGRIQTHKALQHPNTIKVQKLVFSLKELDYIAYKRSGKDYKDIIRYTLGEFEKKNNIQLDWIANIHESAGHPHCHVIIKGVSDNKGENDRYKRIFFKKEDFVFLKDTFNTELEREAKYHWHEKIDFEKEFKDLSYSLDAAFRTFQKEAEREQERAEYEAMQRIRKQSKEHGGRDR